MRLTKNGEFVDLANPNHVDAYKSAGWAEYTESAKEEMKEVKESTTTKKPGRPKKQN